MSSTVKTGFVGLGLMGGPMAANLARAGFPLTVWNRTPHKAGPLRALGATVADSPAQVATASDVVVTMVSDDAALTEVLFGAAGLASGMVPGSVVVDMSTTSPQAMRDAAARLAGSGVALVDAPVFGSTEPATSGDLWAVVGAAEADLDRVRPQLDVMCQTVFHVGPVGAGSLMKVSGNLIVTGMVGLLAESLSVGRAGGLDPRQMLDILTAIDFTSPLWKGKGHLVVEEDFAPRFPLQHALKDVRLAREVGHSLGYDLRIVAGVEQDYAAAVAQGHAAADIMAVVKGVDPQRFA